MTEQEKLINTETEMTETGESLNHMSLAFWEEGKDKDEMPQPFGGFGMKAPGSQEVK